MGLGSSIKLANLWRVVREICPDTDRAKTWIDRHGGDLHRYG